MDKFFNLFAVFVRNHTNISTNIQDKFLISAIREAADIDLQETIGTKLYNKFIELIETETITDYDKFLSLLKYIKYYIAYSTIARLSVISSVKIDNIGLNKTSDEHVENLDISDVFTIEDYYYNKAGVYKMKIQKYIWANHSYFSEWLNNSSIDEIKANLNSASKTGIWLGGAKGKIYTHINNYESVSNY